MTAGPNFGGLLLLTLLLSACGGGPSIISYYNDTTYKGYPRPDRHNGVDIESAHGAPVLASADGIVYRLQEDASCGKTVILLHAGGMTTLYCHLRDYAVESGGSVRRGDVIGHMGTTGYVPDRNPHVHWMLYEGSTHMDPLKRTLGCFDPLKTYPTDHLVLTYPVGCRDRQR
jgi:murein DD-endopeptidase MepM/ murein hydrolase activator NlpD